MGIHAINEVGNRYHNYTVIKRVPNDPINNKVMWLCECDCGERKEIAGVDLRRYRQFRMCPCQFKGDKYLDFICEQCRKPTAVVRRIREYNHDKMVCPSCEKKYNDKFVTKNREDNTVYERLLRMHLGLHYSRPR